MMRNTLTAAVAIVSVSAFAQGPGPGPGAGKGFGFNRNNTPGWSLMTPAERTEHRNKMMAAKTFDECKAIQEEHRKQMEVRAKEKNVKLPTPGTYACDRMKARGMFK